MKPIVADNKPASVDLVEGKEYFFCVCGKSNKQPFCDGSHVGTGFTPKAFNAEKSGKAYLCQCKQSTNVPYCDGTHKQFGVEQIGKEGLGPQANAGGVPVAKPTTEEPTVAYIHQLARDGLTKVGHHGPMTSMGVPRHKLPHWDDLQLMVAQMANKPLMDDVEVATELV